MTTWKRTPTASRRTIPRDRLGSDGHDVELRALMMRGAWEVSVRIGSHTVSIGDPHGTREAAEAACDAWVRDRAAAARRTGT